MKRPIRILIAKPGLDGHDRGAKFIARSLSEAGFEVLYTGIRQTPEQIADAAIQEDVDMVGLSTLSGAHNTLFPRVVRLLTERGAGDIIVFGGGVIPTGDIPGLKQSGIREIFTPGATMSEIIAFINTAFIARTAQDPAIYTSTAPVSALLQQVNGVRPLIQPTRLRPKKHITASLTAIERTCNGIHQIPKVTDGCHDAAGDNLH